MPKTPILVRFRERRVLRRQRKAAADLLHQADLLLRYRRDLLPAQAVASVGQACDALHSAAAAGEGNAIHEAWDALAGLVTRLTPRRPNRALRENAEVLIVAIAAAMAFRTYLVQPFKIPTGSMQPSLYGIHYEPRERRGWWDRPVLNLTQWLVRGAWYTETTARSSGRVSAMMTREGGNPLDAEGVATTRLEFGIGPQLYTIQPGMLVHVRPGDQVFAGQRIASGLRITGDHVFVDKLRWNVRPPRRDQVVVFLTSNIEHRGIRKNQHYIKRLIGLPHDRIRIREPWVLINDRKPSEEGIARVASARDGYSGYVLGSGEDALFLRTPESCIELGDREYFVLGDNTGNSLDGRYWGAVPQDNLVGPAFLVYWPFSRRWGWIR